MNMNYHDAMQWLHDMEQLVQSADGNEYTCWLRGQSYADMCLCLYNRSHGRLVIKLYPTYVNLYLMSIDDSSAVMHGPVESREKALRRMERLKAHIEAHWDGAVPSRAAFNQAAMLCGMGVDYN